MNLSPICLFLWMAGTLPESTSQELDLVAAGYAQRDALIQTVQAECEVRGVRWETGTVSADPTEIIRWVTDGSRFRFQRNHDLFGQKVPKQSRGPEDQVYQDGVSTELRHYMTPEGDLDSQATISAVSPAPSHFSDFRSRTLGFVLDEPPVTVAAALVDKANVLSCSLQENGEYLVEYKYSEDGVCRLFFDIEKGFMVTHLDKVYKDNPRFFGINQEVLESKEVLPGLWMPMVIQMHHIERSESGERVEAKGASRFIVKELSINQPIPEGAFDLKFPVGTEVSDEIRGKLYFQKADGPGPDMPLPVMQVPQTVEELAPKPSSSRTIFIIANLLGLAAFAGWYLLRRRNIHVER